MGEKTCKECRSWEDEIYWTHFQCIQFFKFLHSGFDQRLAIPEIFARHMRKKLPGTVNLKEFVKDHALEENDFLIFKYNGESNFDVLMFNMQSMCEKVASYFVKKYESTERGNGCRTKRKTIKSSAEVVFASPKGVAGGSQPEEFIENDTDAIPGGQPNDSRVTSKKICRGIKSTEATKEDVVGGGFQQVECSYNDSDTITPLNQPTREEIETEPEHVRAQSICLLSFDGNTLVHLVIYFQGQPVDIVLHARRGRKVTEQEKRNAMQLAAIPSAWIVKRIPIKGNQDVILRFKDRAWHTRFFYHKSRDNGGLSAGWKKFALDNKLHEFDVCVFEPLDLCIQFFQFLHSGFDQRLAIPEIFARHMRKKLPGTVNLKGPSGSAWKSMCEKVASYFVKKYESTERGNGCRTKRKTIKSSAEVVFASPKGVAGGSQPEEFIENDTDAIPGGQPNDSRVTSKKICRGIKSTEATKEDVVGGGFPTVECSYNDSDTITPLNQPTREEIETEPGQPMDTVLHARRGRKVTEQEKRNAMQLAVRAVTANGFLILMKPTHVCRKFFMAIPSAWIVKRIPIKGNQDVILRFKDRAWHTRFFYHKSRDNGGLSAGWKKFALDNKLHEFDVCVFEPLDLASFFPGRALFCNWRAIPEIFARHMRKKLPGTVNLKGPSGSAWKSMCEKVASYFVKKYESTERGNGCRTKRKTIKSSAEVVFASPKGVAGGSQPEEFIENDTDAIPGGQPNDSPKVTGKKICRGIKSTEATKEDVVGGGFQQVECSYNDSDTITPLNQPTREEIETEPEHVRAQSICLLSFDGNTLVHLVIYFQGQPVDTVLHARRGRKVTEQEKRNAMQLAAIPSAWIVKRIPIKGNQDVILCFKDRAWHTRFFYHKSRDNGGLSAGWKKFALDNKLHEFDVCVFEPLDLVNCPIILNVNIFRVVEEATNYLTIG
ncbi:BINDING PROTEIN putative-RELATED [Salix purpurea]|uniref:BINDING PROTEIN putative-RELATED n=1 Tax=Salix purpurea TaxID=77065 RepID=A0A9Q0PD90_SALPP|nr:BINDING PROTEIN putative-RELATED [Salix purpurea]